MGQWVNRRGVTGVAMLVVAVIVVLNIVLIYLTVA
jgi:Mn2+/Fe2+ NRAMP family transporter